MRALEYSWAAYLFKSNPAISLLYVPCATPSRFSMGMSLNTNLTLHVTQTANGDDRARELVLAAQVAGSGAGSHQKINQAAGDESVTRVDDKTGAISRIKLRCACCTEHTVPQHPRRAGFAGMHASCYGGEGLDIDGGGVCGG